MAQNQEKALKESGAPDEVVEASKEALKNNRVGSDKAAKLDGVDEAAQAQWSPHVRGEFPDNRVGNAGVGRPNVAYGHFCTITKGDHEGTLGVFTDVISRDKDGYPDLVQVRPRRAGNVILTVPYKDLAPAESLGNGAG